MNFNFGEVLTRAWQIIWKHKVLWIFGILASCSRGNGGSGNGGSGNSGFNNGSNPDQFGYQFERMGQWLENNIWIVVADFWAFVSKFAVHWFATGKVCIKGGE